MDQSIRKRTPKDKSWEEICNSWKEGYARLMQENPHVVEQKRQPDGSWIETYNGPIQGKS